MNENRTEINIENWLGKTEVVDLVDKWRFDLGLSVDEINVEKPWGAYWRFSDRQVGQFVDLFFPKMKESLLGGEQSLSPKFLLIAPGESLSWQYHNRRTEKWRVVAGEVGVVSSESDIENGKITMKAGESICLENGIRHRLIGKEGWGLIAEIWVHTDPNNPSDEDDVVRLQDDYGR